MYEVEGLKKKKNIKNPKRDRWREERRNEVEQIKKRAS